MRTRDNSNYIGNYICGKLFCLHKGFKVNGYTSYSNLSQERKSNTTYGLFECEFTKKNLFTINRKTEYAGRIMTNKDLIDPTDISIIDLFHHEKTVMFPAGIEFRVFQKETRYTSFFLPADLEWEYLKIIDDFYKIAKVMTMTYKRNYSRKRIRNSDYYETD